MHSTVSLSHSNRWLSEGLLVLGFAGLTAIGAQIEIPLYPVPMTMQTAAVLAAGAFAGARTGALSQVIYLLGGLVLPIYAGGASGIVHLVGVTGGYLFAFPLAAGIAGWLVKRSQSFAVQFVQLFLSSLVIFALGATWLKIALNLSWQQALMQGVYPFLLGDAIKCALVAAAFWGWTRWRPHA